MDKRELIASRLGRSYKIRQTGDVAAITMPREILRKLHAMGGDYVEFWETPDGDILLKKSDYNPDEEKVKF